MGEQGHHVDDAVSGMRIQLSALLHNDIVNRRAKVVTRIVHRHHPAMTRPFTRIANSLLNYVISNSGGGTSDAGHDWG